MALATRAQRRTLTIERGFVIQSYPPDVYETTRLTKYLDKPAGEVGWLRVKSLSS